MALAQDPYLDARKDALAAAVDRLRPGLEELSLRIHANPELALEERRAAGWLADRLEAAGFDVERGVAGLETAFVGRYRGGDGPTIAIFGEYDALPGIGHGCGHNVIGASAVGAGVALKDAWPDLPGEIMVVGSPAEEADGGKIDVIQAGLLDGVAAAMMVHPGVRNDVVASLIAMLDIVVEYHGKASHASSKPEDGINALDALVIAYAGIAALRQHIRSDARTHGIITDGGKAPNVVPDYAAGRFYIRARDDEYLEQLEAKVLGCFRAGAEATGARMEYSYPTRRFSAIRNNPTLVELFRANYRRLGRAETPPDPARGSGSSDMGNVSQVVPSIHPSVAIAPRGVAGHSIEFARAAGSPAGMDGLADAAKAMALTVADLLLRPDTLARAAEEFKSGTVVTASTMSG